jgi:D-glycero-alpha-D-manno-heptose 1-phosphate guanylyltransferase
MTAIILAGGLGTRLRPVISNIPKCMAPIKGIPFLAYIINKLSKNGFNNIIIAVSYLRDYIISYFGNLYKGMSISYSIEEEPLGTGGAILKALQLTNEDYIFILNGDTYFDIDYKKFQINKYDFVIAAKFVSNVSRYGHLIVKDDRVINFGEKGSNTSGLINGGVYLLNKQSIINMSFEKKFSLEKDFLEKYIQNLYISYIKYDNFFIDIGIPQDYSKANLLLIYE